MQNVDLNLFQFDYDTTFAVFFISADEQIYGRYGGRDDQSAESRMSLAGLKYAMQGALAAHRLRTDPAGASPRGEPLLIRQFAKARRWTGCIHCHNVKEILNEDLEDRGKWRRELLWRYPPPDNLGMVLEVDRGNMVRGVDEHSPAARAGLRPGDAIERLGGMAVRSFADATFALDGAPDEGQIEVTWRRGADPHQGQIELKPGWRRTDITWRPSMAHRIPSARLYGRDLDADERQKYNLSPKQLAFWQKYPVHAQAQAAGVREDDVILGFDGVTLEMDAYDFLRHVRSHYVVGDRVQINLIRDGRRIDLPMTLKPF